MSKTIVGPGEVATDSKLAIVKKYRALNKKAGDLKRQYQVARQEGSDSDVQEIATEAKETILAMNTLRTEANAAGFDIWVNVNGKTGHTYANDYKETPDADNDVAARDAAFAEADIIRRDIAIRIARLMNPPQN